MSDQTSEDANSKEEMERMRAQMLALQQQLNDLNKVMKLKADGGDPVSGNSGKIKKLPPKNKASTTDDWTSGSDFDEEQDDKKSNKKSPTFEPKKKVTVKKGGESNIKSPIITRRRSVENITGAYDETSPQEKSFSSRRKRKGETAMPEVGDCKKLLSFMMRHKFAPPFNQPVDPVVLGIPDYFNVIKTPMDLGTVSEKMAEYESVEDFAADVRLVWANALQFNPPDHEVYMMAKTLSGVFEKKITPILKKAAAHSSPREPKRQHTDVPQSMTLTIGPKSDSGADNMSLQQKISLEIEALVAEINSVKTQITTLKERLATVPPAVPKPAQRQKPIQPQSTEPLPTREEKAELMQQIQLLSEQQIENVFHIIHSNTDSSMEPGSDEIEIDMERIDPATFRKFQAYVVKCLAEKSSSEVTANTNASVNEEQKVDIDESKEGNDKANESIPSETESEQEKQASSDAMQTEATSVSVNEEPRTEDMNTDAATTSDDKKDETSVSEESKDGVQPSTEDKS